MRYNNTSSESISRFVEENSGILNGMLPLTIDQINDYFTEENLNGMCDGDDIFEERFLEKCRDYFISNYPNKIEGRKNDSHKNNHHQK